MFFLKIFDWIIDPKNRTILLFIIIAILVGLFFYQRSRTQNFKFKYEEQVLETQRVINNSLADQDTLSQYKRKNGELVGEISGYKLTQEELQTKYKNLFTLYTQEKNKPPKFIVETRWKVVENISDVPTQIIGDSLIAFKDSVNYNDGNWRVIETSIPYDFVYRMKKDSSNIFELKNALKYAFDLNQRGIPTATVVAYDFNGNKLNYLDSKDLDSVIYRVQIYESTLELSEKQIAEKYNLDQDYIDRIYEDSTYKFLTGYFIPSNSEGIINENELFSYAQLQTGNATTKLQLGMTLSTALVVDDKTGQLKIQVITKYPGVTFEDIKGAEIMSTIKSNKKAARQLRQEWGVGLNLGVGGMLVPEGDAWKMKFGPVISVGINYTPRWLQFGPRQIGKNSLENLIP